MSLPAPGDPTWITSAPWTKVPFAELGEEFGHEEGQNERGPYARKPYMIRWSDRNQFYRDVRGVSGMNGGQTGNWIRGIPLLYPDAPEDQIYATSLQCKGMGNFAGSNPIAYDYALVTVGFGPLTWDAQITDDPLFLNSLANDAADAQALLFSTQELDYGFEEYPVPRGVLGFDWGGGNPVKATQQLTIRKAVVTMTIIWERLPYLPVGQTTLVAGLLNDSAFLGMPFGTVMFMGSRTGRQKSADGNVIQRVQQVFKYRNPGWNYQLRPDRLVWQIPTDADGNTQFQYGDFSQLLPAA